MLQCRTDSGKILAHVFDAFSTRELLPVVAVCRRFHTVISDIIRRRLVNVASLPENALILECYPPSDKISTPYLSCTYLGLKTASGAPGGSLAFSRLRRLYSSFRPVVAEENSPRRLRNVRRFVSQLALTRAGGADDVTASQIIYLDEGELFSQLCVLTNVVKQSKPGYFLSHHNISDGVVRVWREWLADMVSSTAVHRDESAEQFSQDDKRILWVDTGHNIGLRFRLSPLVSVTPVILCAGDEPPITYTLIYEGKLSRRQLTYAVAHS